MLGAPPQIAPVLSRSVEVATWDARTWLAGLIGCSPQDLIVRSVDRYGPTETQVRYARGEEAVARLVVTGPVIDMGIKEGQGYWDISVRIGSGSEDVHSIRLPQADEITY